MKATFTGIIKSIGDSQTIPSKSGRNFTRREVLVESTALHPEQMLVELLNGNAVGFCGRVGQKATFYLNFRTVTSAEGRIFNVIKAWRYDLHD